jgi:hypothetical protein
MIEYWYCVNIPPRSLVDLKKSGREEKILGPIGNFFFFFFFFTDWFGSRTGSVRFGSDWFGSRTGSVRGLVRFADWFGSRTGSVRGLVRFGSVRGPDRCGVVRIESSLGFCFREIEGETETVRWRGWGRRGRCGRREFDFPEVEMEVGEVNRCGVGPRGGGGSCRKDGRGDRQR